MKTRILAGLSSLLFAVCVCSSSLHAQHEFTITIPDLEAATVRPMVQTADGGFVLLFNRVRYNEQEPSEIDSSFFGLAKLSADGLIEWSRYVAIGAQRAQPVSLLQTADGGFIAVGNVYDHGDTRQDIALLRFNAHGYLLSARANDIGLIDDVTDAILLENGNVMIAGSTKWMVEENEPAMVEAITFVVDQQGEVLKVNHYPALTDYWYGEFRLRSLDAETVALVGSIYDTAAYRSPGLVCLMGSDGIAQQTFLINPSRYFDDSDISDIVSNGSGGYTLLGNLATYDCGGPFYEGFMLSYDAEGDTLWTRMYSNDRSVSLDCFLPADGDAYSVMGDVRSYPDPQYVIKNLNEVGRIGEAIVVSPYAKDVTDEPSDYPSESSSEESSYLRTGDGGVAIANSKVMNLYDNDYNWLGTTREVRITRLSSDLVSCNRASESVQTNGNALQFLREDEFQTETEEAVVEEATPTIEMVNDELEFAETTEDQYRSTEGTDTSTSDEYGMNAEEYRVEDKDIVPFVTKLDLVPTPIDVAVRTIIDHHTIDLFLVPNVLCRENPSVPISAIRNHAFSEAAPSSHLILSPNSIRAGEGVEIAFTLGGRETPEITILTVATGQVVRQIHESAIDWSHMNGRGTASFETDDLAAGVYLVRARSGEQQLTAKLEVR